MIKFAVKNDRLFILIWKIPVLKKFFVLRLDGFNGTTKVSNIDLMRFLSIGNVTTKRTARNRFDDVDSIMVNLIGKQNNIIHDVAVSSGITSLDLYDNLSRANISFELFISDNFSEFFYKGKHIVKVYTAAEKLVLGYIFFFLADQCVSRKFFLSKILFRMLERLPVKGKTTKILLLDKDVQEKIEQGRIKFINYDVFNTELDHKFTYIRCMNLLNLFYFSEETIIKAINNLNESLLEGGILQIGRTTSEGINNVSFYKKQNGRFILVKRLNSGSEIDYIFERLSLLSSGDRRNVTEEIECVDYEMRMLK